MKKILASLIAFCMLFSMAQTTVFAAKDAFVISKDTVSVGDTFNVSFTLPETLVASSLGVKFIFDNEAFEITNIDEAKYADMQPYLPGCNANANVMVSYCDPKFDAYTHIEAGTVLMSVDFKVKSGATKGDKVFEVVDYNVTGKFNLDTLMPEDITPYGGNLKKTVTVVSKNSGSSSSGSSAPSSKPEKEEVKEEVKPVAKAGWVKEGNNWYFYANGTLKKGWLKDGNAWYYLDANGAMKTGWVKDGNAWYFMKSSGAMATGWVKDGNAWYFMKPSGVMATGWIVDGGNWYYLNASGVMVTNTVVDGYTINANGVWVK